MRNCRIIILCKNLVVAAGESIIWICNQATPINAVQKYANVSETIADKPFPTLTGLVFKIRLNLNSTLFKKVRQKSVNKCISLNASAVDPYSF